MKYSASFRVCEVVALWGSVEEYRTIFVLSIVFVGVMKLVFLFNYSSVGIKTNQLTL